MVNGSLGTGCHRKDLGGQSTVPLGLGGPGATIGGFADHVLVGVLVAHTRSGLSHFFSSWTSPIFKWMSLLNQLEYEDVQAPSIRCGANTRRSVEGGQSSIHRYWIRRRVKIGCIPILSGGIT